MKLAVLGNSQIACLKVAWNEMRRDRSLTFFGSRAGTLASLRYQEGKLTSDDPDVRRQFLQTSEGRADEINLSDFDAILIHGLADIAGAARIFQHFSFAPGALMLSQAALQAVIEGWYRNQLLTPIALQVPAHIRAIVTATPNYAERVTLRPEWRYVGQISASCRAMFDDFLEARSKFPVVCQPPETLRAPFLTRDEFSRNSVRLTADLNIPHPDDDFTHMNGQYGRLVLRDVFQAIDKTY
jgi:hypothetical protein